MADYVQIGNGFQYRIEADESEPVLRSRGLRSSAKTRWYTFRVSRAVRSQLNFCERSNPFMPSCRASAGLSNMNRIAAVQAAVVPGGTMLPAILTTSGKDDVSEVMTGVPHAIAARGGSPKPSYMDGKTNTLATLYHRGSSSSGTLPRKRTRPEPMRPSRSAVEYTSS